MVKGVRHCSARHARRIHGFSPHRFQSIYMDYVSTVVKKTSVQGCGNTMPDLSDLVSFHSGQVKNFYLLVLGQVQMYKVDTILYFIF